MAPARLDLSGLAVATLVGPFGLAVFPTALVRRSAKTALRAGLT
jgi:hypothetical protein